MLTLPNSPRVLLLENIHPVASDIFRKHGFEVLEKQGALSSAQLIQALNGIHILGIRSKTQINDEVLLKSKDLISVGCFCIGTNQVDLDSAKIKGIPVFNAPFGNTRSVAELILAEIVMLSRQLGQRCIEMHSKIWKKVSTNNFEVRGKKLGIIGYGNIGSQVSALAEAFGMKVFFFDIAAKLPLGNARPSSSLSEILKTCDFVTLHVPATPQTHHMIGRDQIHIMKKGSYLLNASRGSVVDIKALATAIKENHLAGAALDVYPEEPESNTDSFITELQGLPNLILTPHIGGATEEAQVKIGEEVPTALIQFALTGCTTTSVNFPRMEMPPSENMHRILNVHKNVPGVLREINRIVSDLGANINAQRLATDHDVGYLMLDTDQVLSLEVKNAIECLKTSIKTRILDTQKTQS